MNIGVSTSNLYPMPTEEALECLLKAGFKTVEIFLNTESEAKPDFARKLRLCADAYGARISALHSYSSVSDCYLYFTDYERRLEDGLKRLDDIYKTARTVGARYVIMHGDRPSGPLSDEDSIRRYEYLYDMGQKRGVTLLLENVLKYRSAYIDYIKYMRDRLGEKAGFVFDLKQCVRCGLSPHDVISAMSGGIRHIHISDNNRQFDCLIPGRGDTDYAGLIGEMRGFDGDMIIELYKNNFNDLSDLIEGYNYLNKFVI